MWSRRPRLPDDVLRRLDLSRADKVLAAAPLGAGGWTVATTAELIVTDAQDAVVVRRPWADVDRAAYDPQREVVTVEWVDAAPDLHVAAVDPERAALPQVVRERVQWSVVLAEDVPLPGDRSARVAVRRTADGTLFSQALAGPGVDLADPQVALLVDAAEGRVRAAAGMPL
ncbi:hypothetical protein DNL40_06115 [Xylanimonas oleitrophica]|uniref:Uncharacterized protein n=1 Tax=Xylanimonas oleitrophica TaxID=2607479 RepID=A0A2W5WS91_9MICO|nr:hypothetical protein [Xylanimonas oleitrophica]PZR53702.1 hypothetical protein DNL40_06115 [Xylanimonas oleitrophica]